MNMATVGEAPDLSVGLKLGLGFGSFVLTITIPHLHPNPHSRSRIRPHIRQHPTPTPKSHYTKPHHVQVHYIDAISAVVRHMFVTKFKDENPNVGADLDTTYAEAPALAQNVVNNFSDMNKKLNLDGHENRCI